MKKSLFVAIAILSLSSVSFAAGPISFGIQATGANINVPDPLKDIYGFGFGGGVHLDVNLPVLFAFRLQGDFVTFGADNAKYQALVASVVPGSMASDFSIDGGRINILSVNANTKLSPLPLPILSPYLTAGVGMANLSVSDATVKYQGNSIPGGTIPGEAGQTKFSANLGAGVDVDIFLLKLYLEARYTWIFTDGSTSTYIPVSLGVTF